MPSQEHSKPAHDLLASSQDDLQAVLKDKDKFVGGNVHADVREYDRLQYQVPGGLRITVSHPGGSEQSFRVYPYNLSEGGLGFLHGSFLYPGSRCSIELKAADDTVHDIGSTVVRCMLMRGRVHDIGVKFDAPFKHGWYDDGTGTDADDTAASVTCNGHVLVVSTSRGQRDLIRFRFTQLKADVSCASRTSDALISLQNKQFDLVVVSMWDGIDGTGMQFVQTLRQTQCSFAIVAVLPNDTEQVRQAALQAGCTDTIESLTNDDAFVEIAKTYMTCTSTTECNVEPLVSSMWSEASMRPLILNYVEQLEQQIASMRSFMAQSDVEALVQLTNDIEVTSADYGFEEISHQAQELQNALNDEINIGDAQAVLGRLSELCARAGQLKK